MTPNLTLADALAPGYRPLLEAATRVFSADDRVRALWAGGSVARGDADHASDLDLLVAVADEAHEAFAAEWQRWLAAITPTVLARPLWFAPGSLFCVTPTCERLDVVVERAGAVATTLFRQRAVVFDRDGLDAQVPPPEDRRPDTAKVAGIVEELFRDYGMFDVVVARDDRLLGIEAVHRVRDLLYQLFVEANASPPTGVKRWSDKLTPEQRAVLEALPTGSPATFRADHEAVAVAFVQQARPICERLGAPWPDELEAAVCAHLARHGLPHLEGA